MTRSELIKLLQDSYIDYPTISSDAEVIYRFSEGNYIHIEYLKMKIVDSQPVVILI